MYLYIIFGILAFFSLIEVDIYRNTLAKKIIFSVLLFILFLLSFLRWEVGTDWDSYYSYYTRLFDWSNTYGSFEWLFDGIAKFVKINLEANYTFFLFTLALILYALYYKSILRLTDRPIFALFTLYSFSFAGIFFVRQTLAIAFVLFSIYFIKKRQFFYFLFFILVLAMGFHRTAFIFIPAYFIYNLNLSKMKIVLVIVSCFLIGYIFANSAIGQIGQLLGGVVEQKLGAYQERGSEYTSGAFSAFQTMIRGTSYRIAFILFIMLFLYQFYKTDLFFRGLVNIYIFGSLLFLIAVPLSTALIRISTYYEITQMFLYPYILNMFETKYAKYTCVFVLTLYFLFRFYGVVYYYEDEYIPYKSILSF